jgi:bacterioferritin
MGPGKVRSNIGITANSVKEELKAIAIAEMKHAEVIAERLNYMDGIPTTKPEPIFVGTTLKEMIERQGG